MGLFNNQSKKDKLALAKTMTDNANKTNNEITKILASYEENSKEFTQLSNNLICLAKHIMDKIEEPEIQQLTALTQLTCKLHQEYMKKYESTLRLAINQSNRVRDATEIYQQLTTS